MQERIQHVRLQFVWYLWPWRWHLRWKHWGPAGHEPLFRFVSLGPLEIRHFRNPDHPVLVRHRQQVGKRWWLAKLHRGKRHGKT